MVDPGNSSNIDFVNSQRNDYSWHTNLPFVYQITSSKYHEPIKDQDMEDNYNPNIPEWANVNYLKMFVYDDAQVNILEMALPF